MKTFRKRDNPSKSLTPRNPPPPDHTRVAVHILGSRSVDGFQTGSGQTGSSEKRRHFLLVFCRKPHLRLTGAESGRVT